MPSPIELESTLTDRYQTTVPDPVRRVLGLAKRDRIRYLVRGDGSVEMKRAEKAEDPVLDKFLNFLERDIEVHPERLRAVDAGLAKRIRALTKGVKVDLAAVLESFRALGALLL